jgi:hypothetical protein
MKRNFTWVSAWILLSLGVSAQTGDNFNSRPGYTTSQVKGYLQERCWQFPGFDVNQGSWTPAMEGDGAMVSGQSATPTQISGIYSPVLNLPGVLHVQFNWQYKGNVGTQVRRWFKIYVTDPDNNNIDRLDSVEITGVGQNTTYSYDNYFSTVQGPHKIYICYQGKNGNVRLAIDELSISAPLYYAGGCNAAPVAVQDHIAGSANHQASGSVIPNDSDPDNDAFTAYMVTNSPDGNVVLNADGSFTFTPNAGFAGNTTSFTYRICDNGFPSLCSEETTAQINFPVSGSLPISLMEFKGLYRDNGKVELSWLTNFEQNSDRFDIERSLNGEKWTVVGTVKAQGNSSIKTSYEFIDDAGRDRANKRDLYYRLRQVDKDGKVSVSRILVVRVYNTRTLKMVSVTPNPAKNDINVNVQLNENAFVSMKVLNANGAQVISKSLKVSAGSNTFALEGSSKLKPGMYVLEVIINSKERMIVKLIKE